MIKEFEIFIPDEKIELLNKKIDLTRWPDEINDERWTLGTKKSYLQEAVETWRNGFDWRKHEVKLNEAGSFKFKTKSGLELHYLHKKIWLKKCNSIIANTRLARKCAGIS